MRRKKSPTDMFGELISLGSLGLAAKVEIQS